MLDITLEDKTKGSLTLETRELAARLNITLEDKTKGDLSKENK